MISTTFERANDIDVDYLIGLILGNYNPGDRSYASEVTQVYDLLMKKYYPEFPDCLSRNDILHFAESAANNS